jgi:murein L,D-transpeptidase YcbB/YkuD
MCGSDVEELMRLLVGRGHLREAQVNSEAMFTLPVENAVKAFQRSRQLQPDGKVGPVTARNLRRDA